jgi:exodeoxyribonuclease-5
MDIVKSNNIFRYQDLEYTECQINALTKIEDIIDKFHYNNTFTEEFVMAGYAGTGKTTIAVNIVKYAIDKKRFNDVIILAPTNKAKVVLMEKVPLGHTYFSTLHSFLYGSPDENEEWHIKDTVNNFFILVDESSMINKDVLSDLRKVCRNCLIIYTGDAFQLEPVGEDTGLMKKPNIELTTVKRNDGDILNYATELRTIQEAFEPFSRFPSIRKRWTEDSIIEYVNLIKQDEDCIFLVADNNARTYNNIKIRKLLNYTAPLCKKERLLSIANSGLYANGETFNIEDSFTVIKECTVTLNTKFEEWEEDVMSFATNQHIFILCKNTKKATLPHSLFGKLDYDDLEELVGSDNVVFDDSGKYYSLSKAVTICTYGYALTVHKSQGSQWDTVFVQRPNYVQKCDAARWLYTAVTRAVSNLSLI